ncbi:MAG: hypothetical protein LPK09_11460 [Hymenobacteraceae bacterium]|nr:hypothetical protein [Hymenobacteraceae bacterium]
MRNNYILTLLFLLLVTLALPRHLKAQGQIANRLLRGTHFQVAAGYNYQRVDLKELNRFTARYNYPELSESLHSVGFLTDNISNDNKWIFTIYTAHSFSNKADDGIREIKYRNQQYALGAGYNVLSTEKIKLLPSFMATLGRNILIIQNKVTSPANFQDLVQSPSQEADMRNYSYIADAGLALHYQLFRRDTEKKLGPGSGWVPIIIKAGYQFEIGSSNFKMNGERVAGMPEVPLEGFYASIFIGLGTRLLPVE